MSFTNLQHGFQVMHIDIESPIFDYIYDCIKALQNRIQIHHINITTNCTTSNPNVYIVQYKLALVWFKMVFFYLGSIVQFIHTCIHIAVTFIDKIEPVVCHVEMLSKNDITLIQMANEHLPFTIHRLCEPSWPNSNNF